jgi:hypothetical protein
MKYTMLALSLGLLMPVAARAQSEPPIRLKLSDNTLATGQREKIKVRVANDGYLVVLRTDTQGRVHVLFPVDPTDDAAIKAGKDFEVRGRGGREGFAAFEEQGFGAVLAAWSDQPFTFADFEAHGHWIRAGVVADSAADDAEAVMLGVVDQMSAGPYEYDLATYSVRQRQYRRSYAGWWDPWYDPWYGPWYPYAGGFGLWPWYPYGYGRVGVGVIVRGGGGRRIVRRR